MEPEPCATSRGQRAHLLLQALLRGVQVHPPLLLVGVGSVLLPLFGQSFLGDLALVLPALGQVLQQLCFLTLGGGRGTDWLAELYC